MQFEGLFIPYVTPFTETGEVDAASLVRLTEHFVSIPTVAGLVSCARIGEGTVLAPEEKLEIYKHTGEVAHKAGKTHIATIAPQSTDEAIETVKKLEDMPVDGVMIFPPLLFAWGKVGGDLKYQFWADLVAATKKMRFVLFQIPVQNYWYDPETAGRISTLDRIVAMKEASFSMDLYTRTIEEVRKAGSDMIVLSGNDKFVGKSYELGGRGALIGISNLATEKWGELDAAGRNGDFARALALQEELEDISSLVFGEPLVEAVARIKILLRNEGLIESAFVRRPQLGVSPEEEKRLIASYTALDRSRKVA